jgi:hypothetical protein
VASSVAIAVVAVTLLGGVMIPSAGAHDNRRLGIFPGEASPYGNSYGEWSARWWQWLMAIPTGKNPNLDPSAENCGEGQEGPVWFGLDCRRMPALRGAQARRWDTISGELPFATWSAPVSRDRRP